MDFCQKIWNCGINFCHFLRNFIMQFLKKGQSWTLLYCQRPKWGGHIMQHIYEVPNLSGNAFPAIVHVSCGGGSRLWVHTKWGGAHRIPYYWKRRDELWPVTTHTKWGASSPKVFVAASTQSKLTSESVAITLSSQLTTKMTNFVVFGCFWTPLKTEPKITKF